MWCVCVGKKKKGRLVYYIAQDMYRYTLIDEAVTDPITGTDRISQNGIAASTFFFSRYIKFSILTYVFTGDWK